MKFFFDLLPVILFFVTYKLAKGSPDGAVELARPWLGDAISAAQTPILVATAVAILATAGQVLWLMARGKKVDLMLWVSLGIISVFGGATLLFHDPTFIKWKPTVLYWLFAVVLLVASVFFNRNLIRALMQAQMELPASLWAQINGAWIGFFTLMGFVNLYVAYSYSEEAWVNFKLYGFTGMMLLFVLIQAAWMSRHMDTGKESK